MAHHTPRQKWEPIGSFEFWYEAEPNTEDATGGPTSLITVTYDANGRLRLTDDVMGQAGATGDGEWMSLADLLEEIRRTIQDQVLLKLGRPQHGIEVG
jgi:uncharacterized protein RhaS with RHS repeats